MESEDRHWDITRTVSLAATASKVWEVIGGFYTIHEWHPDISKTEIPGNQTQMKPLRRILTFPGQPVTEEELLFMDNEDFHYRYKWHSGKWGEEVKNYHSSLRIFAGDLEKTCVVQWSCSFDNPHDAISEFYLNGFRALEQMFQPAKGGGN